MREKPTRKEKAKLHLQNMGNFGISGNLKKLKNISVPVYHLIQERFQANRNI